MRVIVNDCSESLGWWKWIRGEQLFVVPKDPVSYFVPGINKDIPKRDCKWAEESACYPSFGEYVEILSPYSLSWHSVVFIKQGVDGSVICVDSGDSFAFFAGLAFKANQHFQWRLKGKADE